MEKLKFKELSPHIDVSFWYKLEDLKLHAWKLDEPTISVTLSHPSCARYTSQPPNVVSASETSFDVTEPASAVCVVPTSLTNFNTYDQIEKMDKKECLVECGKTFVEELKTKDWSTLSFCRGLMYTFSDLKTHVFSYVLAFPVFDFAKGVNLAKSERAVSFFSPEECSLIRGRAMEYLAQPASQRSCNAFVITKNGATVSFQPFQKDSTASEDSIVAFMDSSAHPDYPGWPLRNILFALRLAHSNRQKFTFLSLRDSMENSVLFECVAEPRPSDDFKATGWAETRIKSVELSSMMDPPKLAESSARLNLSLMKWRMMPDIELDSLQKTKALLLGSGTLGCNIARHLFMWGVTNITLVDRGQVSYSNPVRQSLFELKDVTAEGSARIKSIAAANTLKRILPTANAEGVSLTIRMPGHRIDDDQRQKATEDITTLENLIKAHDVIFLLTDSRESRWLPTVLATAHDKPVINAALGFDSYVVMRHGLRAQGNTRVGCYFCNDVVAPIDSLTARTLDQQCTVTRPGVSAIASAIAVEFLAAVHNHPKGFLCPAYTNDDTASEAEGVLGIVPHQVRGNVHDYGTMTMYGAAYGKCTACSDIIVNRYEKEGIPFIIECLNEPKMMEEITGLKAERDAAAAKHLNWDEDDFDD